MDRDFRIESPTDEMRNNEKIHIGLYDGKESVARKLTPEECLKLMGFENFHIVVDDKMLIGKRELNCSTSFEGIIEKCS